jgi:hypothetical protein
MRNALNRIYLHFNYLDKIISYHGLLLNLHYYQKMDRYILQDLLCISSDDAAIILSYLKIRNDYPYKQHLGD